MSATYRYPGVKPFEARDVALFFGRENDRAELLEQVKRQSLTVLFGKSGYGKSSLLKAGLMTDLLASPNRVLNPESGEEELLPNFPVYIRFNLYGKSAKASMPLETLLHRLRTEVGPDDQDATLVPFFQDKRRENTLWSAFKCSKKVAQQRFFLIFDQFEEFFSYPANAQTEFKQQLTELLYTRIPQSVRNEMDELNRAQKNRLHQDMGVHVLFAIRSDRIHLLNSMRDELPAILQSRYELQALSEGQARDAIVKPALLAGEHFVLKKAFGYEPDALQKILSELNRASETNNELEAARHIEAFQLQMVCQTIEQRLIAQTKKAKGEQPLMVTAADLPDFQQIYEQYYISRLADLPESETRQTAHILLEEEMVIGDDPANVRRVSMDKDLLKESMLQNHQRVVTQELLDYLEDKFLLRRETIGGHIHYEISHDVLLTPLMNARTEHREREEKAATERRIAQAEALAQQERAARAYAEKRRRRARWLSIASVAGFICAALVGAWAMDQKRLADIQRSIAEESLVKVRVAEQLRRQAEMEKKRSEFWHTLGDIEVILKSKNGCPDKNQRMQLDTMPQYYIFDQPLQDKVREIREKIHANQCD